MNKKIEKKVTWATVGTYLASVAGLAALSAVQGDPGLLAPLPDVLEPLALGLVPAGMAFLSGWKAKHTPDAERSE